MQSQLAAQKLRLEEVQQRRKDDKQKVQVQGEKLAKWQAAVRRLNNVVLKNNINSGNFFGVRLPFPLPSNRCQSNFLFPGLMSGFDIMLCVALSTL